MKKYEIGRIKQLAKMKRTNENPEKRMSYGSHEVNEAMAMMREGKPEEKKREACEYAGKKSYGKPCNTCEGTEKTCLTKKIIEHNLRKIKLK